MWIFCNPELEHLMPFSELGGLADLICHGGSGKLGTIYHPQCCSMWVAETSGKAWTSVPFPQCSACGGSVRTQLGFRDRVFPFSTWGVPGRSKRTSRVVLHAPSGHWTTNIPDPLLSEHGVLWHGSNLCTQMRVYVGLCVCVFHWVITTCLSVNNSAGDEVHIFVRVVTKSGYVIHKKKKKW